jgi:2-octaprenyl-6-methoxyphenol hydroxylase
MVGPLVRKAEGLGVELRYGATSTISRMFRAHSAQRSRMARRWARLLVACDGVKSKLRDIAGIKTVHFDYGQSGIVTTVEHERPHEGIAEEHFLPAGPFAILPLPGNRSSLVWTERTADAERLSPPTTSSSRKSWSAASATSSAAKACRPAAAPFRSG